MKRLDGKVAVVTGSSSGIGAGIAGGFATEGAAVVLAARRADRLQTIAEQITNRGGVAIPVPTDLTSETQVDQLFSTTVERCGRLDILVNNAGAEVRAPIEELAVEDWDRVMAVNLRAAFLCTRHAMRIMKRQGGPDH